jgi:hypothetical protein
MAGKDSKRPGFSNSRRAFLFRGAGLGTGALAGEGLFQGIAWYSGSAMRSMERSVRELALDVEMLSGALESRISGARRALQNEFDRYHEFIEVMGLPPIIDSIDMEELLQNLEFIEQRYTLAERLLQFRHRLHRRLLNIDSTLENLQPDVVKQVDDMFRSLHGMPRGADFQKQRMELITNLKLLSKAYASAEDTRRIELSLAEEIQQQLTALNQIAQDPLLKELQDEFAALIQERINPPIELSPGDSVDERDELNRFPDLSEGDLRRLQILVEQFTEKVETVNKVLQESKRTQVLLGESEQLIQNFRNNEKNTDFKLQESKLVELKKGISSQLKRLEELGYPIDTRQELIERDAVTETVSGLFSATLANPFRWTLIGIGGLLGWVIGARTSKARKKRVEGKKA